MLQLNIILIFLFIFAPTSSVHSKFQNHLILDVKGIYHIYWTSNNDSITFELQVATKGYIGFGFSPNGRMPGSDIVLGWVLPNGRAEFHDRHALGLYTPDIDNQQNYQLLSASENETHTIIRFTRPLNTCDKEDTIITEGTMTVIYCWNSVDPLNITHLPYHGGHRGSRKMFLLNPQPPPPKISEDITTWDIQMLNVTVPTQETTYWCAIKKLPQLEGPHEFIGYTSHITPGNENIVHHFSVRQCLGNISKMEEYVTKDKGYACITAGHNREPPECQRPIALWAIGSSGETLPEGVGMIVGAEYGGASYFHTSTHYTNIELKDGIVDNSFLRFYLTKKPQPFKSQVLYLNAFLESMVLPPNLPQISVTTYCSAQCTEVFPAEGVKIYAVGFHTHLLGTKLTVRHFRGDTELKPIASDDHYDFKYQGIMQLRKHVTILPGDVLMGTCVYSTEGKSHAVPGGHSTYEEMCVFYLSYYPSTPLARCAGGPDYQIIHKYFGIKAAPDMIHIVEPSSLRNQTIKGVISNYNWTAGGEAKFQEMLRIQSEDPMFVICQNEPWNIIQDQITEVSYPTNATFYVENDMCFINV